MAKQTVTTTRRTFDESGRVVEETVTVSEYGDTSEAWMPAQVINTPHFWSDQPFYGTTINSAT